MKERLAGSLRDFRLPRYAELMNVGLYLEQTSEYINSFLKPLGCVEVTGSMIRNYVKKGLVANPVKKRYGADQIAHLLCIAVVKQVLSLENIVELFRRKAKTYDNKTAYDYFCMEMENILFYRFGLKDIVSDIGVTSSLEKEMLRSAVIAVSHQIYLNVCFRLLSE